MSQLKKEFKSTNEVLKKFNLQSQIVSLYASESLNSTNSDEAKDLANSLLKLAETYKNNWDYGNAIHHAHLVLGRVKLFRGDIDGAKNELSLAAALSGSPQLESFGPNMTLAKELLEKGQSDAVLRYFDDCLIFWKSENSKQTIEAWKNAVNLGKTPEFKGNLVY